MKVLVFGATGYTGSLLLHLLHRHSEVDDIIPVSRSRPGQNITAVLPQLGSKDLSKFHTSHGNLISVEHAHTLHPDVVFSCLPHGQAQIITPFSPSSLIIDLSADFRFTNSNIYEDRYERTAPRLKNIVYGLSEWFRKDIQQADVIANPGCYPTGALLPLLPLMPVITGPIVIHAMSGISGAGKKSDSSFAYCERNESIQAYHPGSSHRHHAEIQEKLQTTKAAVPPVIFNPHLVPLSQGLYTTITTSISCEDSDIQSALDTAYGESPFIHTHHELPDLKWVQNSNRVVIGWHCEQSQLILCSAIDNLWKGASGQAVQNMNIRLGFAEHEGIQ